MSSVDTLIANAIARASSYASGVDHLVTELRTFVTDSSIHVTLPPDTEVSGFTIPAYVSPTQAAVAYPTYEPTTLSFPVSPALVDVGSVTLPANRDQPVVNTSGLFNFVLPSTNLPYFDETSPNLHVDDLVAEMDAVVTPMISNFVFPEIHTFVLGTAPNVTLPVYDAPAPPDYLRDHDNYAATFEAAYERMAPQMQAVIDDKTATWVATYAPEYATWVTLLKAKVESGMDGGALPDQFEQAMFVRAQGRVQREYESLVETIYSGFARSGMMEPPGVVNSGVLLAKFKNAEGLSNQATDIYIERRKSEVQHSEFVMSLTAAQIGSVRNIAISYAQLVSANMGQAIGYANALADKVEKLYEHLIARSQLAISILDVIDRQYASKLKAALSAYDGYRLALDAEKVRTEIDTAKVQQLEAQIQAEGLNINKYSALIDSVSRKGTLEELKIKEYGIRADIFSNKIKAQLAGFDVYKAAMSGDKDKLAGELSKVDVFNSLIHSDEIRIDSQVKQIGAVQAANDARVQIFKSGADIYRLGMDTALNKFTTQAEVKKLAQSLYGQELVNAIEEFKVGIEIPKLMIDSILRQYVARVEAAVESARVEVYKLQISESASASAVGAYGNLASAALGSLNTVASSAISASA